ncbi:MAG: RDD family protein [Planctomycetes bacterium]|nr:RDD family protein [Planctomycetota bacterium]
MRPSEVPSIQKLPPEELVGCRTSARFVAANLDHLIALLLGGAAAMLLKDGAQRYVLGAVVYAAYYFLLEGLTGRTIGKFSQGLVVKRVDGGRAGWREAACRSLIRLVEVNPLLLGGLPAAITINHSEKHQRLGDMWARTVVIEDDR